MAASEARGRAGKSDTIAVTARIPAPIYEQMERDAEATHSTITRVIIKALQNYLSEPCPRCDGVGFVEKS